MPQGVTNAPSTFQRLMEKCMGDMHLKDVLVFIDDLIVFSKTLEEHEARLMKVHTCLKEFRLKLSPESVSSSRRQSVILGMWFPGMESRLIRRRSLLLRLGQSQTTCES